MLHIIIPPEYFHHTVGQFQMIVREYRLDWRVRASNTCSMESLVAGMGPTPVPDKQRFYSFSSHQYKRHIQKVATKFKLEF